MADAARVPRKDGYWLDGRPPLIDGQPTEHLLATARAVRRADGPDGF